MANFDILVVQSSGVEKRTPSSTNSFDFLNVRIGASNLLIQESSGALSIGAVELLSSAAPTTANSLANKAYVDSLVSGLRWKDPVRAIATTNITLSGPQTIDGVSVIAGNRVAVIGQSLGQNNGIYTVNAGAWTRTSDADLAAEVLQMAFFVEEGSTNADTAWVCTTNSPITLGTTPLTFTKFSNILYTAGNGLDLTGNQFSVVAGDAIKVGASVAVDFAVNLVNDNASAITQNQVVYVKADGDVDLAQATIANLFNFALGIVEPSSIASAATGKIVVRRGAIISGLSGLTPGRKQYLSRATAGAMTESLTGFVAGEFVYSVGRALSSTTMIFDPQFEFEF